MILSACEYGLSFEEENSHDCICMQTFCYRKTIFSFSITNLTLRFAYGLNYAKKLYSVKWHRIIHRLKIFVKLAKINDIMLCNIIYFYTFC